MEDIQKLINKIKEKPELKGLADDFVKVELNDYMKKNNVPMNLSEKLEKNIVKEVRAQLRHYTGQFQYLKRREDFLEYEKYLELLETHKSALERLPYYPKLKEIIIRLKPSSILDIGCGLNPIALASSDVDYYASDIKEDELSLISKYFKKHNISGKVFYADARSYREYPKADLCLMLKLIDLVDKKGHKTAESLLTSLKCKQIIISFSTKTISGKPMNHPQRGWIEQLLTRLGYKFELVKVPNELFYIATQR